MTPIVRTTGCARPHIVHHGYASQTRVPGPLHREPEPSRFTAPALLVGFFLTLVVLAGNVIGG